MKSFFLFAVLLLSMLVACKKDTFINSTDALLSTSTDSIHFDTVFTSTGSVTQYFKVYNDNNQKLRISEVKLAGGAASVFQINVDGSGGPAVNNLELDANDSLYVFVTVKINPSAQHQPFVLTDSVSIDYNGNKKWVQLEAWGQNAKFLRSHIVSSNETWTNELPYVILGGLQVDTNVTLTIQKGCKIYVHADAPILVDGTLRVSGERYDSTRVVFSGDRLDEPYRDFPAGWPGIFFRGESKDNVLDYLIVKNAYQGLVAEQPSPNANPKLTLNQCIIDNCYDAGLFAVGSSVRAQNLLVSNCGKNILLVYGGNYYFNHCTSVAFSNSYVLHKEPVLLTTDFIKIDNSILTANMNASFVNSIFWGDNGTVDDEVVTSKQGNSIFNVSFQNCLWKVKNDPSNVSTSNIIANQYPSFDSVNNIKRIYSFRLKDDSPAINKGVASSLTIDLDGKPRPVGLPDLGVFEKQ